MATNYLPARDADLLGWAQAFSAQVTATPTAFGLVAGQATTLAGFVSAYQSALAVATNEATRTKSTVAAKDVAKANLLFNIRLLVAIVQAYPSITDAQVAALGLTVRSTTRSPVAPPATFPLLTVIGIQQRTARLAIADELSPDTRARPANVVGMELYYQVGGVAPVGTASMVYGGLLTRTPTSIELPEAATGLTVYMRGRWINNKGERGPSSPLVSAICA